MRVVHLIGGGDEGGAKSHVLSLVQALGEKLDVSLISYRKGSFHDDALAIGIDAHVIRSRGLWSDVRRTLRIVHAKPTNLLHAHGAKGNLVGLIVRQITGIPLLTTVHSDYRLDYMHSLPKKLTYGVINTLALRLIRHHVAVSGNFRTMLTERGFDPQHIYPVYNGIPFDNQIPSCSRAAFFAQYHIPFEVDCLLIGIMARLHPVKDHETFLRAAAGIAARHRKARFLIGGPGEEKNKLERLAEQLGIRHLIHFAGMVTQPYDFFQVIDINVLTSLSESFPYVILEGARFSVPVVSSRVGGLSDLIHPGKTGFLFEPRDVAALTTSLDRLCSDAQLRQQLGQALHDAAEERFSLKAMCTTQLEIYALIMADEKRFTLDGKRCDITLLGYYGYSNSGDEAILKSLTDTMRHQRPEISFTVMSRNPGDTRSMMQVAAIHRFNLIKTVCLLRKSRLFAAGGGSLIQDNTSTRSILYYLGMLVLAKSCGARTMLLANGLGPISRQANRRWAHWVLDRLDAITLRDPDSLDEAKALNISQPHVEVTADPAMLLEPCTAESICREHLDEWPEVGPFIGFSIRKWSDLNQTVEGIAKLADYCVSCLGASPIFIPMQVPDDVLISRRIMARMQHKAWLLDSSCPPDMLMTRIGQLDFMVGMRLHSLIYAANMCVPMAGLVYEPKVASFLEEAGQPVLGHIGDGKQEFWLTNLMSAWSGREQLGQELRVRRPRLKGAAARNVAIAMELVDGKDLSD